MGAVYNELDPFASQWLRNLIAAGHIAPGEVDDRSIEDLTPADVAGPGQRHFFAGIGGWSYALRLAGIPDDADVWTGSCPCQPFSSAGKRGGTSDARHLWPTWFALIEQCRPPIIFGEQVASVDGLGWLDSVYADLERCGYSVGAADLCAAGVGAPHIRQRLYFVAYANSSDVGERVHVQSRKSRREVSNAKRRDTNGGGQPLELGNADSLSSRRQRSPVPGAETSGPDLRSRAHGSGAASEDVDQCAVGDSDRQREDSIRGVCERANADGPRGAVRMANGIGDGLQGRESAGAAARAALGSGYWSDAIWIDCHDGKRRPIPAQSSLFPLAPRLSGRVAVRCALEQADAAIQEDVHWYNATGVLKGSGNAIVPQVAAAFIRAAEEARRR